MKRPVGWHHDVGCQPPDADAALSMVGDFVGGNNHIDGEDTKKVPLHSETGQFLGIILGFESLSDESVTNIAYH